MSRAPIATPEPADPVAAQSADVLFDAMAARVALKRGADHSMCQHATWLPKTSIHCVAQRIDTLTVPVAAESGRRTTTKAIDRYGHWAALLRQTLRFT